jgi:hypothetical protein
MPDAGGKIATAPRPKGAPSLLGRIAAGLLAALLVLSAIRAEGLSGPQQVVQEVFDGLMKVLREDHSLLQTAIPL